MWAPKKPSFPILSPGGNLKFFWQISGGIFLWAAINLSWEFSPLGGEPPGGGKPWALFVGGEVNHKKRGGGPTKKGGGGPNRRVETPGGE